MTDTVRLAGVAAALLLAVTAAIASEPDLPGAAPPAISAPASAELPAPPAAKPRPTRWRPFAFLKGRARQAEAALPAPINLLPPAAEPSAGPASDLVPVAPAETKVAARVPQKKTAAAVPLPRPRPERPAAMAVVAPEKDKPESAEVPYDALPDPLPDAAVIAAPVAPLPGLSAPAPTGAPAASSSPDTTGRIPEPIWALHDLVMGEPVDVAIDDAVASTAEMPIGPLGAPYEMVRKLQTLQDQIAAGSTAALVAQRRLRKRIDQEFASADAAVWQDHRNAAAAVIYVLSGGAPTVLQNFTALSPPPAIDDRLVRGALAYVEGREKEAGELLAEIDPMDLPPSMGAQVALAQAALVVRDDSAKSLVLLDIARLLAPGTLVEEAALRREIFVADQIRAQGRLESFARRYLQRFRHSVYAGNFRHRFAAAITHMAFIDDPDQFKRLDDMLAQLERDARRELYLTVSAAAVVEGKATAATLAADRALALVEEGTVDSSRAHLYRAAVQVTVPDKFDAALGDLGGVDRNLLVKSDQALLDVVAGIAESIRAATVVVAADAAKADKTKTKAKPASEPKAGANAGAEPGEAAAAEGGEAEKPSAAVSRAEEAIKSVDVLLAEASE